MIVKKYNDALGNLSDADGVIFLCNEKGDDDEWYVPSLLDTQ